MGSMDGTSWVKPKGLPRPGTSTNTMGIGNRCSSRYWIRIFEMCWALCRIPVLFMSEKRYKRRKPECCCPNRIMIRTSWNNAGFMTRRYRWSLTCWSNIWSPIAPATSATYGIPVNTRVQVRLSNSKTQKLRPVVLENTLQGCH